MPEPLDVYADQFMVSAGPYGASLTFMLSPAHPDPHTPSPAARLVTVRMSVEHLKSMAVIIARHVRQVERQTGVSYELPSNMLGQMGIAREDWDAFWRGG
ncbi:MAG: hypothetical protein HY686_01960 [Chloroflexi bacterium]|nr:hypothetical protein [Chloroflexota bacterium]